MHRTPARQDFRRNIVGPDPRTSRQTVATAACRETAPWAGAPWGAPCPQIRHQPARRPARATAPHASPRGGPAAWPRSSWRRLQVRDRFECCVLLATVLPRCRQLRWCVPRNQEQAVTLARSRARARTSAIVRRAPHTASPWFEVRSSVKTASAVCPNLLILLGFSSPADALPWLAWPEASPA